MQKLLRPIFTVTTNTSLPVGKEKKEREVGEGSHRKGEVRALKSSAAKVARGHF